MAETPRAAGEIVARLAAYGLRADAVAGWEAAGETEPGATYTVLVADLSGSGIDCAAVWRHVLAARHGVPFEIVALADPAVPDAAIAAVRSSAFAVLRKPAETADLADTVCRAHASAQRRGQRWCDTMQAVAGLHAAALAAGPDAGDVRRFLAIVPAELQDRLAPVIALAELMASGAAGLSPAQISSYAGMIQAGGEQLAGMLRMLALPGPRVAAAEPAPAAWGRPPPSALPAAGGDPADGRKLATSGELAAGMAHELAQSLAGIGLAAENGLRAVWRDRRADPAVVRKLERIHAQAQRAIGLIDHMRTLGLGRSRTGLQASVPMEPVVRAAVDLAEPRLRETAVAVIIELAPDLPPVRGTAVLLEQVLLNLLLNACDAYADNPSTTGLAAAIWVRGWRCGTELVLEVADRAGGIAAEVIGRLFEPFVTTKPPHRGSGLGLAVAHGTVVDLGGRMSARNDAGGAVFRVVLPTAG